MARDPNRDKAYEIWLEYGGKITNRRIADLLGIDEKKLAVWRQRDKWSVVQQPLESVVQQNEGDVVQQKKRKGPPRGNKNAVGNKGGAPRGNQNAKGNRGGNGGPPGNKKAVTTGEHESIWFDTLDEDEQELLCEIDKDPAVLAAESIALLSIRERRMLKRIQKLTAGLTETQRRELQQLRTVKEAIPVYDERAGKMKTVVSTRDELVVAEIEEKTVSAVELILQTEEGLTRVQAQKLKAIKLLYEISSPEQQARVDKLRGEARKLGINDIKVPLRIEIDYGDDADEDGEEP